MVNEAIIGSSLKECLKFIDIWRIKNFCFYFSEDGVLRILYYQLQRKESRDVLKLHLLMRNNLQNILFDWNFRLVSTFFFIKADHDYKWWTFERSSYRLGYLVPINLHRYPIDERFPVLKVKFEEVSFWEWKYRW